VLWAGAPFPCPPNMLLATFMPTWEILIHALINDEALTIFSPFPFLLRGGFYYILPPFKNRILVVLD
jgi:hypothetical protein